MGVMSADEALCHRGSLLSVDSNVVAPYDLEQQEQIVGTYLSLDPRTGIQNASVTDFDIEYPNVNSVHVINGMGVTLGDSIIGLTAIDALRHLNPALSPIIYRPALSPDYVDQLYHLARGVIAEMRWLPWSLSHFPSSELKIDVGNQLFWPAFSSMPMIDFFLWALGVEPSTIPSGLKANRWLQRLNLPLLPAGWGDKDYVLFCPTASTPIRSIPASQHYSFITWLKERFGRPVLGFGVIDHPHYINIQDLSTNTGMFLSWVKHARFVLTPDTAAVHIAAGFDVPTAAIFTSISPELRVRDYPYCYPIVLDIPELHNMQASARQQDIDLLEKAYCSLNLSACVT